MSFAALRSYFRRIEDHWRGESAWHARAVQSASRRITIRTRFARAIAAARAMGFPETTDSPGRSPKVRDVDLTIDRRGHRVSAADASLHPAAPAQPACRDRCAGDDTRLDRVAAPPVKTGSAADIARGARSYATYCAACHGFGAISGQVTPDLRRSGLIGDAASFRAVVHDGPLLANGMPRFGPAVRPDEIEAIRAFLISEAAFEHRAGG